MENYLNTNLKETELPTKSHVFHREVEIPPKSSIDGKKIRDLKPPEDCLLVKIIRDTGIILTRGNTIL